MINYKNLFCFCRNNFSRTQQIKLLVKKIGSHDELWSTRPIMCASFLKCFDSHRLIKASSIVLL